MAVADNATLTAMHRSLSIGELVECVLAQRNGIDGHCSAEQSEVVAAYERGDLARARKAILALTEARKATAAPAIARAGRAL